MEQTIKLTDLQDLFNNKNRYFLSETKGYVGVNSKYTNEGE